MQNSVCAAASAEPPDPAGRYVRAVGLSAVMVDDRIDGRKVVGFVCNPPARADLAEAAHDHVLLEGDERQPVRPLRECARRADRCGPLPPRRLPGGAIREAGAVAAHLPGAVTGRAEQGVEPFGTFFARLYQQVWGLGHLIWVVGGSVRDLIADGPEAKVNDLDFSGTAPPGLMASLVRDVLTGMRLGDERVMLSPGRVCWVELSGTGETLLEYKALDLRGLPFAASGGDLRGDAETRDLTVNSVHYDPLHGLVLDPTEQGLAHLGVPDGGTCGGTEGGRDLVLSVPYRHGDPFEEATILVRLVKFVARWRGEGRNIAFDQPKSWVAGLPADLPASITGPRWEELRTARDAYLKGLPDEAVHAAAADLGPMAGRLLRELDVRFPRVPAAETGTAPQRTAEPIPDDRSGR